MTSERQPHLMGRYITRGFIEIITGLHIGGNDKGIEIGGVDKVVIRNSLDNQPYIPGSSLKGKLRSLLERAKGLKIGPPDRDVDRMKQILIHSCQRQADYDKCAVCNLFGVPSNWEDKDNPPFPTRIVVRDCPLDQPEKLLEKTELPYTEAKTEVSIDRLTSAANPRQFERVPAGARFRAEFIINFYQPKDVYLLDTLLFGMGLLEGDYLGGQGTRGYGQVAFKDLAGSFEAFNGQAVQLPEWAKNLVTNRLDELPLDWKKYAKNDKFASGTGN